MLRRWLLDDFGLDVVELSPVAHGADLAAQVWKATTATNTYAVKWSGAGTNTGHQVAAFLAVDLPREEEAAHDHSLDRRRTRG